MRPSREAALGPALVEAAAVLASWAAALYAEDVALGFLLRDQFSGPWEVAQARHVAGPIAVAMLAPLAVAVVAGWRVALGAAQGSRTARLVFTAAGAIAACALALGVTQGRHFASWGARAPFVVALTLAGAASGRWGVAWLARGARHPVTLGLAGLALAIAGWTADAYVLPRLYPAFHLAMLGVCLLGAAMTALGARTGAPPPGKALLAAAGVVAVGALVCAVCSARATRALERATNLRLVLVEHAPLMGRAVALAMALRPP